MSRGFARGFQVGFNAVDSVIRQKEEKEERDRRNAREDERWGYEKDKLENERKKAADLALAARDPVEGKVIGEPGNRSFAAKKQDQDFMGDVERSVAELEGRAPPSPARTAVAAGGEIVDPSDRRAQGGRSGYLARVSAAQRKHGDVTGSITTEELGKRIEKEGYKDALDYILAGGDPRKAQEKFNGVGAVKLDGELVATPTVRKAANGVEMPDMMLSVRDKDGNVRELGSALQLRFMADNPAEYLKLLNQEQEGALKGRQVAATELNAQTNAEYRRDLASLRRLQLEGAARGGSGGAAPTFKPLSTVDEKAVREFLLENLPDGVDINVATDLAARVRSANPGISLSQAAHIAATPGVTIRKVNTNVGPMDAIVLPGANGAQGSAVLLAPGASMFQEPGKPQAPVDEQKPAEKSTAHKVLDWVTGSGSPKEPAAPAKEVDPKAAEAERVEAKFQQETREIEQGTRREYSQDVKARLVKDSEIRAERMRRRDAEYAERERQRMLKLDR